MTAPEIDTELRTRLGRSAAERLRRPGPPRGTLRPARIGSIASSAQRFAAGTARPIEVRRALAGPEPTPVRRYRDAAVSPPRWWAATAQWLIAEAARINRTLDQFPEVIRPTLHRWARRVSAPELPPRGLPRSVQRVPDEKTWTPGRIRDSLVPKVVRIRRLDAVAAAGPMLSQAERAADAAASQAAPPPPPPTPWTRAAVRGRTAVPPPPPPPPPRAALRPSAPQERNSPSARTPGEVPQPTATWRPATVSPDTPRASTSPSAPPQQIAVDDAEVRWRPRPSGRLARAQRDVVLAQQVRLTQQEAREQARLLRADPTFRSAAASRAVADRPRPGVVTTLPSSATRTRTHGRALQRGVTTSTPLRPRLTVERAPTRVTALVQRSVPVPEQAPPRPLQRAGNRPTGSHRAPSTGSWVAARPASWVAARPAAWLPERSEKPEDVETTPDDSTTTGSTPTGSTPNRTTSTPTTGTASAPDPTAGIDAEQADAEETGGGLPVTTGRGLRTASDVPTDVRPATRTDRLRVAPRSGETIFRALTATVETETIAYATAAASAGRSLRSRGTARAGLLRTGVIRRARSLVSSTIAMPELLPVQRRDSRGAAPLARGFAPAQVIVPARTSGQVRPGAATASAVPAPASTGPANAAEAASAGAGVPHLPAPPPISINRGPASSVPSTSPSGKRSTVQTAAAAIAGAGLSRQATELLQKFTALKSAAAESSEKRSRQGGSMPKDPTAPNHLRRAADTAAPGLSGADLLADRRWFDELVDRVVRRIESHVIDELERRGRRFGNGAY